MVIGVEVVVVIVVAEGDTVDAPVVDARSHGFGGETELMSS